MTTPIIDKNAVINEYACYAAERDLVEAHDMIASQLRNEEGQYLDKYQGEFNGYYNTHYAQLVKLSQSPIENEMDEMWGEYVAENDEEPKFARCLIRFEDDSYSQEVTIKLSDGGDDGESEDNVFYYCTSLNDLKSLIEGGSAIDFNLTGICSFHSEY